jgi:hypothetical protein
LTVDNSVAVSEYNSVESLVDDLADLKVESLECYLADEKEKWWADLLDSNEVEMKVVWMVDSMALRKV